LAAIGLDITFGRTGSADDKSDQGYYQGEVGVCTMLDVRCTIWEVRSTNYEVRGCMVLDV
jgi:hypothetical protein